MMPQPSERCRRSCVSPTSADLIPEPRQTPAPDPPNLDRPSMEVDIACAGFGPAMGGFLTTLTHAWTRIPPIPPSRARSRPACPCRSSATSAPTILPPASAAWSPAPRAFAPAFPVSIPPKSPWPPRSRSERVLYLLDPIGASRRSSLLRLGDFFLRLFGQAPRLKDHAFELPWTPPSCTSTAAWFSPSASSTSGSARN